MPQDSQSYRIYPPSQTHPKVGQDLLSGNNKCWRRGGREGGACVKQKTPGRQTRLMVTCCFSRFLVTSPLTDNFLALARSAKGEGGRAAKRLQEEGKQQVRPKVALEGKGHIPKSLPGLRPAVKPKVQWGTHTCITVIDSAINTPLFRDYPPK